MWKPPQRIKFHSDPGCWPSQIEAQDSRLFSPVQIGTVTLNSRTWIPAMVPWRASPDGLVTDDVLDWYERFAQGQPGAIVVEATGIRDIPSGPLLRIGDDRFIPGLQELVQTVRRASGGQTRLFIQLIDFLRIRRRPAKEKFLRQFLQLTNKHRQRLGNPRLTDEEIIEQLVSLDEQSLSEILDAGEYQALAYGERERVTDTDLEHIRELPKVLPSLFAVAAKRAQEAGFDGVELHYAHAYTMASFLSALNTRADGYGGNKEQRVRLPLQVFHQVREKVGSDYIVGCRFLSQDCIAGGSEVDDAAYFAVEFARAGMDFLSLSRGGKFDDAKQPKVGQTAYPYTGPSGYECMPAYISDQFGPFGRNVTATATIRQAVRDAGFTTPVIVSGGMHGFTQAESILLSEQADLVAFARQSLADPDWFHKVRSGHGGEVRVCEYTNYCEGLDQKHKQVTCQLWDRVDCDKAGVKLTADRKRRLVAPPWKPGY